ncbi:hypothetical protein CASFOL_018192 [Castilleja foliolosa]|uniref:Uncharacterized protein n=1 Tax=Castilleja foliolosa TaxID=1961234 RepID=A0ABD3BYK0_9LAMI
MVRVAARRRCWCDDGRIKAAKALLIRSPSTVPIRTREFVIADLLMFNLFGEYGWFTEATEVKGTYGGCGGLRGDGDESDFVGGG